MKKMLLTAFGAGIFLCIGCGSPPPENNMDMGTGSAIARYTAVTDQYQASGRKVLPYLQKLHTLSDQDRDQLWRDVAAGKLDSFDKLFGAQAKDAHQYLEMVRKVEGSRPGEYPPASRLKYLYDAWAKSPDENGLMSLVSDWTRPVIDGFQLSWVTDLSYPDGSHVKRGDTIKKSWQIANTGTVDWPKDMCLELLMQTPDGVVTKVTSTVIPALLKRDKAMVQKCKVEVTFTIPKDAPTGAWTAWFVTVGPLEGRRQYMKPRVGLLLTDRADLEKAMADLLNAKLVIDP